MRLKLRKAVLSVVAVLILTFVGKFLGTAIVSTSGLRSSRDKIFHWDDKFIQIKDTFYVYSAYFDGISERKPVVRLIAIDAPIRSWDGLICQFYDSSGNPTEAVPARKVNSTDAYSVLSSHSLTFFLCDLKTSILPPHPAFVVPRVGNTEALDKELLIPIRYPPSSFIPFEDQVAACVQPLHSNYIGALPLLEWIEYHRLLGVTHFTFYNHSVRYETDLILRSYDSRFVTILNWNLPPSVHGVRVYGQLVAASDCVYRNRGKAKYVMTFDTDEFLTIPSKFKTFAGFFDKIWETSEARRKTLINHVQFMSKVSFTTWEQDETHSLLPNERSEYEGLLSNLTLISRSKFLPAGQTKFVMRPDRVVESGVHWAQVGIKGSTSVSVDRDTGFYFHFRDCCPYYHKANQVLEDNATCLQTRGIQRDINPRQTWGALLIARVIEKIEVSKDLSFLFDRYTVNKSKIL